MLATALEPGRHTWREFSFFLVLAVLGLLTPSGLGVIPIGGADILLHLAAGGVALWIGTVKAYQPLPSVDAGTVTR